MFRQIPILASTSYKSCLLKTLSPIFQTHHNYLSTTSNQLLFQSDLIEFPPPLPNTPNEANPMTTPELLVQIFHFLDRGHCPTLRDNLRRMTFDSLRDLFQEIPPRDAIYVLEIIPHAKRTTLATLLPKSFLEEIRQEAYAHFLIEPRKQKPTIRKHVQPSQGLLNHTLAHWREFLKSRPVLNSSGIYLLDPAGHPTGILNLYDLCRFVHQHHQIPIPRPLPPKVSPNDSAEAVWKLMIRGCWHELPVVNSRGKFLGVVHLFALANLIHPKPNPNPPSINCCSVKPFETFERCRAIFNKLLSILQRTIQTACSK
ncbi:MAG: CBS domain-containing protein [Chthoniobacterales bacterium]|nr:CBS domain-containing protein [Chthoniobacterales bacterium]